MGKRGVEIYGALARAREIGVLMVESLIPAGPALLDVQYIRIGGRFMQARAWLNGMFA